MSTSTLPANSPLQRRLAACAKLPIISYARITIELTSPLHIGSGHGESDSDAGIVMDANGLAAIPGSSIKGVLRHAYSDLLKTEDLPLEDEVFGTQVVGSDDGQGGRITVSWAHVHDRNDIPVDRPVSRAEITGDPVLRLAAMPELRDHVRLDHRGTAADKGKFDELCAAPGLRFTFSLELHGSPDPDGNVPSREQHAWNQLLLMLTDPLLRFGGKSRRGFGFFEIVEMRHRTFRLDGETGVVDEWEEQERNPEAEWLTWLDVPNDLGMPLPENESALFYDKEGWLDAWEESDLPRRAAATILCELESEPDAFWMIAGQDQSSASDSSPLKIKRVTWRNGCGVIETVWVIPGSSIKGSLRHRTAFHYRRLNSQWAMTTLPDDAIPTGLDALFGFVRARNASDPSFIVPQEVASPGHFYIDDVIAPTGATQVLDLQNHVTIDRVLGGAVDQFLFDDQPLLGGKFKFRIRIADHDSLDPLILQALDLALDDLCQGRLALGAHAGRGYGFFRGTHTLEPSITPIEHE